MTDLNDRSGAATENPYVGPRTFTIHERNRFFGREREARDLLARVVSERLLLFYAQSGAGKSSLLQTCLIPQLREEKGFGVLPVGRVSGAVPAEVRNVTNIYLFNLMAGLDPRATDPQQLAHLSLSRFLAHLTSTDGVQWSYIPPDTTPDLDVELARGTGDEDASAPYDDPLNDALAEAENPTGAEQPEPTSTPQQRYVLIIDQFEEIITTQTHRRREREAFFRQLNQALLDDLNLWVVLTLREDYVAALDPYAHLMDNKLRARFYMERMGVAAALAAVRKPAALAGLPFAEGVAEALVDNLRRINLAAQDEVGLSDYVEPVQLQVVCYQLWEKLQVPRAADPAHAAQEITHADLQHAGDVDRALSAFYEDALAAALAAPHNTISERQLRTWFDDLLITPAGTRGTVYQDAETTAGIPNAVVETLQRRFLLRTELRAGGAWVELIHDRLIPPIVESNRTWLARQSTLLRAAQRWADGDRSDELLYSAPRLEEALKEAGGVPQDPLVQDFVEANRAKHLAAGLRRRAFRLGLAAVLSMIITTVVFVLWTDARVARNDARAALNTVQRIRVATESLIQRESAPQRGLLLAVEATELRDPETGHPEPQAFQALYSQFAQWDHWQQTLIGHTARVNGVAFGPSGGTAAGDAEERLYSVAADERLLRWGNRAGQPEEILRVNQGISAMALHNGTRQMALGTERGELLLVAVDTDSTIQQRWQAFPADVRITALAFTPDGTTVVTGGSSGQIHFRSVIDPSSPTVNLALPAQERCVPACWVRALAVSDDGAWFAAGGENRQLALWRLAPGAPPTLVLQDPFVETLWAATFSRASDWLAAGDGTGELRLYALAAPAEAGAETGAATGAATADTPPTPQPIRRSALTDIRALAFSPVAPVLAVGDGSGVVGLVPVGEEPVALQRLGRLDNAVALQPINAVAFNATGDRVASGGMDGTVRLWQTTAAHAEPTALRGHTARVRALALHPGPLWEGQPPTSDTLISAGEDETVRVWSLDTSPTLLGTLVEPGNQILTAAIDPTGTWLATGGRDGQVRLYRLTGTTPDGPEWSGEIGGEIATVAFSPPGDRLAVGGSGGRIWLWSLPDLGQAPLVLENGELVSTLAFDRTGNRLASGDTRWVKLWDLGQSLPTVEVLYTHDDWVWSVAFSPDERFLASISADSMVRLTPLVDGVEAQGPILAHEQRGRALAFAPTGALLATAGDDQLIRLWDPTNLDAPPAELHGHQGEVRALAFRADGKQLLSAGTDRIIRQWTVDLPTLQTMACARVGRNLTPEEWALYFPATPYHATCPAVE